MSKLKCPEGVPGWIVSYGDMMSLLLTFFIMLYAMSSIDAKKAETVTQVMRETFGTSKDAIFVPFPAKESLTSTLGSQKSNRSQTVETVQSGNPTKSKIPVIKPVEKITKGVILFENDSDTLGKDAIVAIQETYQQLKGSPLMIELRGHTGLNERGANSDSMDLAYARAYMVRKHLIDLGIDPIRIIVTAWGTNHMSGSVVPSQVGVSNAYVEVVLISETPENDVSSNSDSKSGTTD